MKKGFTLVELIGVIIIIALITLLALPPLLNMMNSNKKNISETNEKLIYSAADLYISENVNSFPKYDDSIYCIALSSLVNQGLLNEKIYENNVDGSTTVKITVKNGLYNKSIVSATECINSLVQPDVDFKIETIGTNKYIVIDTYKDGDTVSTVKTENGETVPNMRKNLKIYVVKYTNNTDTNPYSDILNYSGYNDYEIGTTYPTVEYLVNNGFNTVITNQSAWGVATNVNAYFEAGINVISIGNDSTSALSIISSSVNNNGSNSGSYAVENNNNITKRIGNLASSTSDSRYMIKFINGVEVLYSETVSGTKYDAVGVYSSNNTKWIHSQVSLSGDLLSNYITGALDYVSNKNLYYYKVSSYGTYRFEILDIYGGGRTIECVYN